MLEYIILGTLYDRDLTGYDVHKCIEDGIGMFYKASYGSIYPLLARLLELGMLTCTEDIDSARKQKIYHMTEQGRTYFHEWLKTEETVESKTEAFMAKVYFFDRLGQDDAGIQIEQYQKKAEAYLAELMMKREQYLKNANRDRFYYKLSTLYFGIVKLQSIIEWCKTVQNRSELEKLIMAER